MTEIRQATQMGQRDVLIAVIYSIPPLAALFLLIFGLARSRTVLLVSVAVLVCAPVAAVIHREFNRPGAIQDNGHARQASAHNSSNL